MFVGNCDREVNKFMEALDTMTTFDTAKKTKLRKKFKKALFYQNPETAFDFINHGIDKRCYALDDEGQFVIKFCNPCDIDHEIATLKYATKKGLKDLFINGYYFNISCCRMKNDYSYVIIQPRIIFIAEDDPTPDGNYRVYWEEDYKSHRLYDNHGKEISYSDFLDTRVSCVKWMQTVINIYGMDMFKKFRTFVNTYDIDDLHTENLGYISRENGKLLPVIIDWAAFKV